MRAEPAATIAHHISLYHIYFYIGKQQNQREDTYIALPPQDPWQLINLLQKERNVGGAIRMPS